MVEEQGADEWYHSNTNLDLDFSYFFQYSAFASELVNACHAGSNGEVRGLDLPGHGDSPLRVSLPVVTWDNRDALFGSVADLARGFKAEEPLEAPLLAVGHSMGAVSRRVARNAERNP